MLSVLKKHSAEHASKQLPCAPTAAADQRSLPGRLHISQEPSVPGCTGILPSNLRGMALITACGKFSRLP